MLDRRRIDINNVFSDRRDLGSDRRVAPRYRAGGTNVILTWAEDDDYRTVGAVLRDISLGGGSALADNAPPTGSPAWFRLHGDDSTPWIGVTVIAASRTGILHLGPRLVRWRFSEACPYQVFKAAIDGFSLEMHTPDQTVHGYNYRDWR